MHPCLSRIWEPGMHFRRLLFSKLAPLSAQKKSAWRISQLPESRGYKKIIAMSLGLNPFPSLWQNPTLLKELTQKPIKYITIKLVEAILNMSAKMSVKICQQK